MPSKLAFVAGGLLEGFGRGLAEQGRETGKAKRERVLMEGKAKFERILADLEQKNRLDLEGVKQKGRYGLLNVELATKLRNSLALRAAPGAPKLATGYRRIEGGQEFTPGGPADPKQVKALAEAGRAPDGDATPAQRANDREIDEARKRLREIEEKLEPGVSLAEEIHRRIGTTDPTTGRRILDYNSFLGRTAWQAMQRKIGPDQEQARWSRVLINPPEFTEPAGPKALLPGVSAEKPDVFDSVRDFFSGGNDQPAPQPGNQQAAPARPQALDRFPGRAPSSVPQPQAAVPAEPPRLANGGIDRDRLVIGQVYRHPVDGRIYRWTGDAFEAAD